MNLILIRILQIIAGLCAGWGVVCVASVQQQSLTVGATPDASTWLAAITPAVFGVVSWVSSWFVKIKSGLGSDLFESARLFLSNQDNKEYARRFFIAVIAKGQEYFQGNPKLEKWLADGAVLLVEHFLGQAEKTTQKAAK